MRGRLMCTDRAIALGVAPVPMIPGGKAPAKIPEDLLWPSKAFIPPTWHKHGP